MSREAILARIRESLSVPTDTHVRDLTRHDSGSLPVLANGPDGRVNAVKEFLPFVGDSFADHVEAFATLSKKLQTELVRVADRSAASNALKRLTETNQWKRAGIHDCKLVEDCIQDMHIDFLNTNLPHENEDLESCDVGITGCDALIAQTASVLVTSQSAGGRAISVLPPHHVVVATAEQMVTTMADGFAILRQKHGVNWPSFISFITGPSRTADIERVLVLGAHGPKKLTVILVGDDFRS